MIHPVTDYANKVLAGEYPACRYVKQACKRHLDDLNRDDVWFDEIQADYVIGFIQLCVHIEGEMAGTTIELEPSQVFIVGCMFGWKYRKTGLRKYKTIYVEIPRKNGKSTLLAPIGLYMLAGDGEQGAQIYSAATKEKQAKIVWGHAHKMAKGSPALKPIISTRHNSILHNDSGSRFEPLGSDSDTQDGWNPHAIICDELHAWKGREYWDVLEDAFGARSQPMMIVITTAGHDKLGICYEQRQHAIQILDPDSGIDADTYFGYIATIDEEDQEIDGWEFDHANWYKANPTLGKVKRFDAMEDLADKARSMPGKLNTFVNKQLNVWTDGETKWFNMGQWDEGNLPIDTNEIKGTSCFAGLDLSSTTDITALVLLFPPGFYDEWAILPHFYIPEDNLRERIKRDKVPYDRWIEQGLITATEGDYIDLEYIKRDYTDLSKIYSIRECGYDPWKAVEIANKLEKEGAEMVAMIQGHKTLVPGVLALEEKLAKGMIRHAGNPVLRWMASNATTREDANGNHIPDKKNSYSRIDGISALLNAMCRAIVSGADKKGAYEERGIITF